MKKYWKIWCDRVDNRNSRITYANYEEAWSYYTPIIPVLYALFFGIVSVLLLYVKGVEILKSVSIGGTYGVITFVIMSLCMYLNWRSV